jgi:hypothetical protein
MDAVRRRGWGEYWSGQDGRVGVVRTVSVKGLDGEQIGIPVVLSCSASIGNALCGGPDM